MHECLVFIDTNFPSQNSKLHIENNHTYNIVTWMITYMSYIMVSMIKVMVSSRPKKNYGFTILKADVENLGAIQK